MLVLQEQPSEYDESHDPHVDLCLRLSPCPFTSSGLRPVTSSCPLPGSQRVVPDSVTEDVVPLCRDHLPECHSVLR